MSPKFLLFDLGGVLIELGGTREVGLFAGRDDLDAIWAEWLASPVVRDYERGLCSTAEFGRRMVESHRLTTSPDKFLKSYEGWTKKLHPGAADLLARIKPTVPYGCFSNTCALHWQRLSEDWGMEAMFETRFLSFEMGLVKPDREVFDHVAGALGVTPGEILFLDDNRLNVDGALGAGFDAHETAGLEAARRVLEDYELLEVSAHQTGV